MARTTSLTKALTPIICLMMLVTARATAQVPCEYDVTIIQAPVDCGVFGTVITIGSGLNEHGAVVGYYKCPGATFFQGFVWTAEDGYELLNPPAGVVEVIPADINDNGVICGTLNVAALSNRGFVYDHGKWTILDPVVPNSGWSSASAINNAGVVVGQRSITKNLNPQNAYFWSGKNGFTDLGIMNGPNSSASAISESGLVAGWTGGNELNSTAFLWDGEITTLLGSVPRGTTSIPTAITDDLHICGWGRVVVPGFPSGVSRAFLWNSSQFTMLGTLPDHLRSAAFDLNTEIVVGTSWTVDGNPGIANAALWVDITIIDLNNLIYEQSKVSVETALGITNSGQIVALGSTVLDDSLTLLLTPIASPSSDLNNDCEVDVEDLIILLGNWGPCDKGEECVADLNGDGTVRTIDLVFLLGHWG